MKSIVFIGQAPARPGSQHQIPGTYLHSWLRSIGFNDSDLQTSCHFLALVDAFPGSGQHGHLPPTKEQIASHRPALVQALSTVQPAIIVPVGKLAIQEVVGDSQPLQHTVGQIFTIDPFNALGHTIPCIPFSHPSGRSMWNHAHKDLVQSALDLLRDQVNRT